jgi:hypothetical protein
MRPERLSRRRSIVWYLAIGPDGQFAGGNSAKDAALGLQETYSDPVLQWAWRNLYDEKGRAELKRHGLSF